jgi:hypothetical protein
MSARTLRVILAAACAAGLAACGGSTSSANSIAAPSATVVTDTFNGTVPVGSFKIHTFTVTSPGTVTVTMTAAGPPATITMGLAIGNPDANGNCIFLSGGVNNQAIASATTPQLQGTLTTSGAYCVEIADVGNAASPITYSLAVSHT